MGAGRFAPSPTGDLHLGNLRTALLAWVWARSTGRDFYLRLEDLDTGRVRDPSSQIADLRAIGLEWDGPIVVQSDRKDLYEKALQKLDARGEVFECFCSRRDVREAVAAAHAPPTSYAGPCATLSETEKQTKRDELAKRGAKPAKRLLPKTRTWTVDDQLHGRYTGPVESVVLQRGDGEFAYNLAVVVDDIDMGVDQVVRGDDLLASSPTQAYICDALGGFAPTYVHVPLVLGPGGERLAKRDGAVTLAQLEALGMGVDRVVAELIASTGVAEAQTTLEFLQSFEPETVLTDACTYSAPLRLLPVNWKGF